MMPYQSLSLPSPGESHWIPPLDPAWLKWSHLIAGELLRIHWEGPQAIAGAHSKTIHDGRLEGRRRLDGVVCAARWSCQVAKHHFHWEKMGNIWKIVLSGVALRLMVCFEWLTHVCLSCDMLYEWTNIPITWQLNKHYTSYISLIPNKISINDIPKITPWSWYDSFSFKAISSLLSRGFVRRISWGDHSLERSTERSRREKFYFVWKRNNICVCLKIGKTPKPNGFADHYPVFKWLFHWEYTLFSDKPILELNSRKWMKGRNENVKITWETGDVSAKKKSTNYINQSLSTSPISRFQHAQSHLPRMSGLKVMHNLIPSGELT